LADVGDALRAGKIRLGVARELNKMENESWMKFRLAEAVDQGATERVVRDWRISDAKHLAIQQAERSGSKSTRCRRRPKRRSGV
jgi:ribosomal protein S9